MSMGKLLNIPLHESILQHIFGSYNYYFKNCLVNHDFKNILHKQTVIFNMNGYLYPAHTLEKKKLKHDMNIKKMKKVNINNLKEVRI